MFTDSYLPAHDGVATSVAAVSKELRKRGHKVYVIAPQHPHVKDPKNVYRIFSVQLYKQPEIRVGFEVPQPALLKISAIDFDIIHGHSGGAISFLGWQLAIVKNVPFVETYHTLWKYYHHYFLFPRLIKPGLIKKISMLFGNDCDALIAPSEKAKYTLKSYGIKKPIYVVPSGIEREKFMSQKQGFIHERINLPKSKKILLSVGRLEREKSIDFLIQVFSVVNKKYPDTVLVIVGEGRDKDKLQNLVYSLGLDKVVFFMGVVKYDEMPKLYADSHLFIFASQTETQGLVIAEALASEIPVVAVDDTAFDGVVKNGINGYLVKKNIETFSTKVINVIRDGSHYQKLKNNARNSTRQFSAETTAKTLESIYYEVLQAKKTHKKRIWPKLLSSMHKSFVKHVGINKQGLGLS